MRAGSPGTSADAEKIYEDSVMDTDSNTEREDPYDEDSELYLEADSSRLRETNEESGIQAAGGEAKLAMSKLMEIIDKKEQELEKKNKIIQNLVIEMRKDRDEIHEMKRQLSLLQEPGEFKAPKGKKRPKRKSCEGKRPPNGSGRNGGKKTKIQEATRAKDIQTGEKGTDIIYTQKTSAGQKAKSTQEEAQQEVKVFKPPSIVLREEGKLDIITKETEVNDIVISNCKDSAEEVKLFPKTAMDHRRLKKLLDGKGIQCHTYCMKKERRLKIALRGIPKEIKTEDVQEELKERGFPVLSASRLKKAREEIPLILINAEKSVEGKGIFDIKEVQGCKISTEPKGKPTSACQCFRCQNEPHPSFECPRKGTRFTPTCAKGAIRTHPCKRREALSITTEVRRKQRPPFVETTDEETKTRITRSNQAIRTSPMEPQEEIKTEETDAIIKRMAIKKAPGPDGIANRALKLMGTG
ncbi:hypothetical protein Trydic_g672 [Trypoxylus dichotomus]